MFPTSTKVLIVDDLKVMRIVIKKAFTSLGFANIIEAEDGDEAWKLFLEQAQRGTPFDLIISDLNMPNMPGVQLLRQVRYHKTLGKTPFLMVTTESEKDQIMEAIHAGVNSYIVKPFTPETFKNKLEEVYQKL